jgi:cell division transport system permease protein
MIGISFARVMRNALRNFRRNVWLSIATTVIMTLTLLTILFLYTVNVLGVQVLSTIEQKVDIAVIFKDSTTSEQIATIQKDIDARSDVESTRLITSDQAREDFRRRHADDPYIEEALRELQVNPLPSSMFIVATDPRFYETISASLQADKYASLIEKVNFQNSKAVIEKMIRIMDIVKNAGLIITATFSLLVILIMFNTIRLAIYSFREEIDIMRLVGASRWYIQGPFLIESVLVAVVSTIISTIILYTSLNAIAPQIDQFFFAGQNASFDIYHYFIAHWVQAIGIQLGASVALAVISSYIAVRRYLR